MPLLFLYRALAWPQAPNERCTYSNVNTLFSTLTFNTIQLMVLIKGEKKTFFKELRNI